MKNVVMLAAFVSFAACEWPPISIPGGGGEGEGECGECTSDLDCPDSRCSLDECLPWCACPACAVCAGHCEPIPCGGIAGIPCPPDFECVDDPGDDCDPARGGADCPGICVPVDDCVCPAVWDPVCGEDGVTYGNECEARCAGVGIGCRGECPCVTEECGECTSDHECPGSRCNTDACLPWCACPECDVCAGHCESQCGDGFCDPGTPGMRGETCETCPEDCGECASCRRINGIPCPPGYECVDDPTDDCPPTRPDCPGICVPVDGFCGDGVCEPSPMSDMSGENCLTCPEDCGECDCDPSRPPEPEICGDGIDNDCDGLIDEDCDPMMCAGIGGWPCPPGYECVDDPSDECYPERGDLDCAGICIPDGCFCNTEYKPVCGADGRTYPNECEADCAGVPVECWGECPCEAGYCGDGICDPGAPGTVGETCETCPEDCGECDCDPSRPPEPEICGDGIDNDCDGLIDEGCGGGPECGGFAGIPCPPGYECVDDLFDDCDPSAGGADCPGVCAPSPCGDGAAPGEPCPPGYECVDDPDDNCPPTQLDCPGHCVPLR